ncbi:GGDEF domain-containing protein [Bowmanella dokdonensis]|uniref:diguanylate cyclase n=1 Tax=Bowmanella dokdonensis TaxID=751969 RepID=A0A939DLS9_9ALTE|nr:GGDEF domain-containing protein [Bowmanella dokdonensis]MBN7824828.1 diguanylate cyclase [Bowmanella dokdonensis]
MEFDSEANTVRLDLSSQNQQKVLRSFKHQIDTLSQFILRLSKFYENVNPLLDKELQVLRGHLGGKVNFTLAEVSIGKLTALIMENSDQVRQQNQKVQTLLERAVKSLQESSTLPAPLRQETQSFLQTLRQSHASLYSSLPHFEQVLSLCQKALTNLEQRQRAQIPPVSEENLHLADELHQQITDELKALITQLGDSDSSDVDLVEIRNKLVRGLEHHELLECCLIIIRAILKDVLQERKHAERFISGLHKTLTNVSQTVGDSLQSSQASYQEKIEHSTALRQHIQGIEIAIDEAVDLALLKQQANEYLGKMSATLDRREKADQEEQLQLMNLLREMKDQLTHLEQETNEYKQRLLQQKYHSHHDPLTQIPNRNAYNDRIELEYRRWKRYGADLSLALVDIDHFKSINDNYGHAGGDKTLQVIAQHISKCLRSTDFMARWGGEEFIVLFPQTSLEELEKPLEQIRQQVERIPFKFKDRSVTITVSIGAASFVSSDDVDSVFERADRALYDAKRQGRNRWLINKGS